MKSIECVCSTCGISFIENADFIIPGIEGFVNTSSGFKTFIDPDKPRLCLKCREERLVQLCLSMEEAKYGRKNM